MNQFLIIAVLILSSRFGSLATDAPTDQSNPQQLAGQIITYFETRNHSELTANVATATPILENATNTFQNDYKIYFALAICYLEQDNKLEGLNAIEKAYRLSQHNWQIGLIYALECKMNKRLLKAYALDKEMLSKNPNVPQLQINLAVLEMSIQKYDEAIEILEPLQQSAPASMPALDKSALLFMLGTCYLYTGNQSKAIDDLESALATSPKMVPALAVLGEAYLKTGRMEKASETLDNALATNPTYPRALFYKGICFEQSGNSELAQKSYQDGYTNVKRYLGDNGEDYYLMYLICQKLNKTEEGNSSKIEAGRLLFTYEAPWKQN
jgi:tetratricopeptide (TPR) repeat protein